MNQGQGQGWARLKTGIDLWHVCRGPKKPNASQVNKTVDRVPPSSDN